MEIWKSVADYEEYLEVSNLGRVKALARTIVAERGGKPLVHPRKEHILAAHPFSHGYNVVAIKIGPKRPKLLVHRLVARAFVPGYEPGLSVNHIDGNKLNNAPENLEWVSLAENTKHQWRTGLVDLRGERCPTAKLTSKRVLYIRKLLRLGIPAHTIAIVADVSPATISLIQGGKRWASVVDLPHPPPL